MYYYLFLLGCHWFDRPYKASNYSKVQKNVYEQLNHATNALSWNCKEKNILTYCLRESSLYLPKGILLEVLLTPSSFGFLLSEHRQTHHVWIRYIPSSFPAANNISLFKEMYVPFSHKLVFILFYFRLLFSLVTLSEESK